MPFRLAPCPLRDTAPMRWVGLALGLVAVAILLLSAWGGGTRHARAAAAPKPGQVVVIVGENTTLKQLERDAPYLNRTLRPHALLLTDYHGVSSGSGGDYVGMTSGRFRPCMDNDALPFHCHVTWDNLFSQLDRKHISWQEWNESMTNPCDILDSGADWSKNVYSAHHDAAIYYARVEGDKYQESERPSAECRARVLPMGTTAPNDTSAFDRALASGRTARFLFIVPNDCEDAHDPCGPVSGQVGQFDAFLRREIPKIEANSNFGHGTIILTEDAGNTVSDTTLLMALGAGVRPGARGGRYDHYGLLAALERHFGLSLLAYARHARPVPIG